MFRWLWVGLVFGGLWLLFPPEASARRCRCPNKHKPVCGTNGKTYRNACIARCKRIRIKRRGACRTRRRCPRFQLPRCPYGCKRVWTRRGGCRFPGKCLCRRKRCRCPRRYKPVCGTNGKTYRNACVARCKRVKLRYKGPCKRPCPKVRTRPCPKPCKRKWRKHGRCWRPGPCRCPKR